MKHFLIIFSALSIGMVIGMVIGVSYEDERIKPAIYKLNYNYDQTLKMIDKMNQISDVRDSIYYNLIHGKPEKAGVFGEQEKRLVTEAHQINLK
jgi:hypothetical protein